MPPVREIADRPGAVRRPRRDARRSRRGRRPRKKRRSRRRKAPAAAESRRDTHGDADATGGARLPSTGLTEFLAPPHGPGEIGRLGPYRVLKVLGAGGMGVVFQAEDPQLQRLVALKAMLPALAASASARERFLREARAAAAVEHDHIVAIYQVGEDRGVPFLAMPLLKGEPLEDRLKRDKRLLPSAEVLRIGREIAAGLAAAHAARPDPPRHQAGQHLARGGDRPRQDPRLRPGPGGATTRRI